MSTSEALGFPDAVVDRRLRERDFGTLEGLTRAAANRDFGITDIWIADPPGGETSAQAARRVGDFCASLSQVEHVLIFSHGVALRLMIAILCFGDWRHAKNLILDVANLGRAEVSGNGALALKWWNRRI
jgi:broad specificity phosphatase PhoE